MASTERFDGYLFSKLFAIGSRSEGPRYFLQHWDYHEEPIVKRGTLWQEDPVLHAFLGKKVSLQGMREPDGIHYDSIEPFQPAGLESTEHQLTLALEPEADTLWVDKMPPQSSRWRMRQHFDLTLSVEWPYRSIWRGHCPTSQLHDFFIEHNGQELWRWSKGHHFAQMVTPVRVPGGAPVEYKVTWHFSPRDITEEGTYTAHALFIASGQSVQQDFVVRFAH